MNTTQQHLGIKDIQDDILLLKDGGGALVLSVSAVNFGLLSEREQMAIIYSFAQMLNSLSYSIQIVILSERLNISSYLLLLDKAQKAQTNPLLAQMIISYKQFIEATVKENEVLDKKFYLVIPLFALELGLYVSLDTLRQKVKTVLLPRRDQLIRQLSRVGLRASQLDKGQLIELFYNIYNGQVLTKTAEQKITSEELAVRLKTPQSIRFADSRLRPTAAQPAPQAQPNTTPLPIAVSASRSHPFVVEELEDNI